MDNNNTYPIGYTYYIIEDGKRVYGSIESYQGDTGQFWVKWEDGEITLESKIDHAINNANYDI